MKKLIIAISSLCALGVTQNVNAFSIDEEYVEVYDFFNENLDDMTSSYEKEHNVVWNASYIEEITDIYDTDENKIGYLIIFDQGYLAYRSDFSVLDVSSVGYPSFYKTTFNSKKPKVVYDSGSFNTNSSVNTLDEYSSNIYYPLLDYYLKDGFSINSSMVQIPYFKDVYDSSSWGNYQGITLSYVGANSGGILATMSLMYTLKVNGGVDLTPAQTHYQMFKEQLYFYVDFDYNESDFTNVITLSAGINHYLSDNFGSQYNYAIVSNVNTYVPAVTLYYNSNATESRDYCMRVGFSQEPDWWIFNTYYDIVMANSTNFYHDSYGSPTLWFYDDLGPFYVVNQNYRNEMFQFFEGNTLLK